MLLAAAMHAPGHALAAASAEEIESAMEKIFAAGDYQRELPLPSGAGQEGREWSDPDWWRDEGDAQAPDISRPRAREWDGSGFRLDLPPEIIDVLRLLMWVVLFAGGALILYYLLNEARLFTRWKKGDWRREKETAGDPAGEHPRHAAVALEDYDKLAAQGDYAGAVHALLLNCIADFRDRGAALSTSLTSREILRRLRLEKKEKEAMSVLVSMAELTHFGGRGATEADFRQCRDLLRRIVGRETGGAS
jgi:hypothetical protein